MERIYIDSLIFLPLLSFPKPCPPFIPLLKDRNFSALFLALSLCWVEYNEPSTLLGNILRCWFQQTCFCVFSSPLIPFLSAGSTSSVFSFAVCWHCALGCPHAVQKSLCPIPFVTNHLYMLTAKESISWGHSLFLSSQMYFKTFLFTLSLIMIVLIDISKLTVFKWTYLTLLCKELGPSAESPVIIYTISQNRSFEYHPNLLCLLKLLLEHLSFG